MIDPAVRALLAAIHGAGVAAAQGEGLVRRRASFDGERLRYRDGALALDWPIPRGGRLVLVGAGKAAASLAAGLEAVLGDRIAGGMVVVKHGHPGPLRRVRTMEGGHPVPDAGGAAGTAALLDAVRGLAPDDRVIVALTGGASALLVAPVPPLTLADEAAVAARLVASGLAIEAINAVRRRLSRVRGGGLARAIGPAASLTLAISDVPSGDLAMIGSGPTVVADEPLAPDEMIRRFGLAGLLPPRALAALVAPVPASPPPVAGQHRHLIVADSDTALDAAAAYARAIGRPVELVDRMLTGETHAAAEAFAARLRARAGSGAVLLAAGETTLTVTGAGSGGRNQEFALVAARALAGTAGLALLAAGTDGTDGPTEAAGAFADGGTVAAAAAVGLDAAAQLSANDSHPFFAALGDLHVTGPTGTNVMDLIVGVAG